MRPIKTRNKIRKSIKQRYLEGNSKMGFPKGYKPWNTGKKYGRKYEKMLKERAKKISLALIGREITWKEKISKAHIGKRLKEKNPAWNGGTSFEPYSTDWTETLRKSIRERDKYTCQNCWKLQGNKMFICHHIDYDKKNCNPTNLITLCHNCHSKTNGKRNYWKKLFQNKIKIFYKSFYSKAGEFGEYPNAKSGNGQRRAKLLTNVSINV